MSEKFNHLIGNKRKATLLIIILGIITAIGPLSVDMYLPSFVNISEYFNISESKVQLSLTSYFIGISFAQIFYGPVIDAFGKKKPLYFGLLVFFISSIFCIFSKNIEMLIIARFFQAVGSCACMIIPRAIIRDIYSTKDSAKYFSYLLFVMGIAPILAPIFGGFLLNFYDWQAIFIFTATFCAICIALSYFFVPETHERKEIIKNNFGQKISNSFVKYKNILADKSFLIPALSGGFSMAGLFSYITGAAFIYIKIFDLSPQKFSYIFSCNAIGFIFMSQLNVFLLRKFSMNQVLEKLTLIPLIVGSFLIILAFLEPNFWLLTIALFLMLASVGAIMPNTGALALDNQKNNSGSASALLGTIQFFISAISSFLVGYFNDGSIMPICLIFGICAILAFLVFGLEKKFVIRKF